MQSLLPCPCLLLLLWASVAVATVLHFEKPCDAARTRMLGWEGRFEPLLVGGRMVVRYPLQDLTPEDRFLLLVTPKGR